MKTKNAFTVLLLIFSTTIFAQGVNNWQRYRSISNPIYGLKFPVEARKKPDYVLAKDIKYVKVSSVDVNKRGREKPSRFTYTYNFDDAGMVSYLEILKKGKKVNAILYTYNDKTVASKIRMNKKGEIEKSEFFMRKDSLRGQEYMVLKDGDTTFRSVVGEIKDGVSTDYYYKKGKLKNYWVNTYYPNKSLKQTTLYNGKGKEKYIWDYQCKEEGIEIKKHKDTTTRCEEKSTDANGITTYINHIVNEKGETFQTINKRNKAGKYFYYKRTKGPDALPIRESLYTYLDDDTTLVAYTSTGYKKGNVVYQYKYTYDGKGNETSRNYKTFKKGEIKSESLTTYTYDDTGRPIKRETSDKLSAEKKITLFDYSYSEEQG